MAVPWAGASWLGDMISPPPGFMPIWSSPLWELWWGGGVGTLALVFEDLVISGRPGSLQRAWRKGGLPSLAPQSVFLSG